MTSQATETPQQAALRLSQGWLAKGYQGLSLFEYTASDGSPLYWRLPLKHPTTLAKWIRPMMWRGGEYTLEEPNFPHGKPLYCLHALANRPSETVWLVEGEPCVDALHQAGLLATTSGWATSAESADWQALAGRAITIWPDNDEPGKKYAQSVANILHAMGCAVKVIDLSGLQLPPKGDVVNWLDQHPDATVSDINAIPTTPFLPAKDKDASMVVPIINWQVCATIQAPLKPVPAFDADSLLPEVLRDWVLDEADRMQCPVDFIGAAVMVALGTIVGARCAIKPKRNDNWLIVPNLWGGVVGVPSTKKSPSIGNALKPLDRLITRAAEEHKAQCYAFEIEKTVMDAKAEAISGRIKTAAKCQGGKGENLHDLAKQLQAQRQHGETVPTLRRYKSNDTTVEKLGELLRDNPAGILMLRDELVGLIATWDKEGREGERAFYLEAWNGTASFDTDRIARGSINIPNLCVSVFGGIQPDKLTMYLEQAAHSLSNDGMLQRFQMLVYPDQGSWEYRDVVPVKVARDDAFAIFDQLAEFDPVSWGAQPANDMMKFPHFSFDPAAQAVYAQWASDLHKVRLPAEEHPIIQQHLAKYDKLFPALALLLHLVECAAHGERGPVTEQAALRAVAWCEYLESHARRCYGLLMDDGLRSAQALADRIKCGAMKDQFTLRDVRRNQWRYLTDDEAIQAALDWLEDEGWLM